MRITKTLTIAAGLLGLIALQFCATATIVRILEDLPAYAAPRAALLQGQDGALYGTTYGAGGYGYGTVFRRPAAGPVVELVTFHGWDGANPYAGLVQASDGALYGVTESGGDNSAGTVFRVTTNGDFTLLVSFATTNGSAPRGTLVQGDDGALYGTTYSGGGPGYGTVFRITTNGSFTTLLAFSDADGAHPIAGLTKAADGTFYGTTAAGGGGVGLGTIFQVTTNGQLTVLWRFDVFTGGSPRGGLILASDGALYGATLTGGLSGHGTVFQLTTNGLMNTLADLDLSTAGPQSGLVQGLDGAFYGAATEGRTLFRVTTNGLVTVLASFGPFPTGQEPWGGLAQGQDGALYGVTAQGGLYRGGTLYRVDLAGPLHSPTCLAYGWMITFEGLPLCTYRLLRATDPTGPWSPAASVPTDSQGLGQWVDDFSPTGQAFYKTAYP